MKPIYLKSSLILLGIIAVTTVAFTLFKPTSDVSDYFLGIHPPTSESIPFSTIHFDADSGFVYKGQYGTQVEIPKNAFVNSAGEKISGEVEFKIREFHGVKDIFLSGIPMQARSGDEFMMSSGMIELRAFQGNDTLELKEDKSILVNLASTGDSNKDYDLFYLENDKEWGEPMAYQKVKNRNKETRLKAIDKIDKSSDSIFQIKTSFEGRPYLKIWKNVDWMLFACDGELPYNVVNEIVWDYVDIQAFDRERKLFKMRMISTMYTFQGKTKQFQNTLVARPLLSDLSLAALEREQKEVESDLAKAVERMLAEEAKAKTEMEQMEKQRKLKAKEDLKDLREEARLAFEQRRQRELEEYNRVRSEAAVLSKFRATRMGIYNIDHWGNFAQNIRVDIDFKVDGKYADRNNSNLFMLFEEDNSVVRLPPYLWSQIPVVSSRCSFVIVMPDGFVGIVDSETYRKNVVNLRKNGRHIELDGEIVDNDELDKKLGVRNSSSRPKFI